MRGFSGSFYGPRAQVDQLLPEMAIDQLNAMPRVGGSQA